MFPRSVESLFSEDRMQKTHKSLATQQSQQMRLKGNSSLNYEKLNFSKECVDSIFCTFFQANISAPYPRQCFSPVEILQWWLSASHV